ncbi:MAG: LuxR C-terminal-related transcriptional regulator [Pseudomonadota bacterium]
MDGKLSALADLVAATLPLTGDEAFPDALVKQLRQIVPFDDATLLYYAPSDLPLVIYQDTPQTRSPNTMERFVAGAFLLDPYYQCAHQQQRFGLFRLSQLAPESFEDSEYYQSWYRNCGFNDECGYLIDLRKGAFANLALGRAGNQQFSDTQCEVLNAIRPAIDALCHTHFDNAGAELRSASGQDMRRQMHLALEAFGSSLLTTREAQVINLVLHGHSSKSVAERLGISGETVKLHRKHAYAKLEVGSQAELFYLFLDSLMSAVDYQGGDTLVSYLSKPIR